MLQTSIETFGSYLGRLRAMGSKGSSSPRDLGFAPEGPSSEVVEHLIGINDGLVVEHSIQDAFGQIFDCVPLDAQPAARLSGRLAEPPVPDDPSPQLEGLLAATAHLMPACPEGLVPLQRVSLDQAARFQDLRSFLNLGHRKRKPPTGSASLEDRLQFLADYPHRYAVAFQRIANTGGRSSNNLWKPRLSGDQIMSLSQIWCSAGDEAGQSLQTVEAGWQVCPNNFPLSNANPVFFIYWTADNYNTTGSYNNLDRKFCLTSNVFPIGGIFNTTSAPGGQQYDIDLSYRMSGGNWWLYIGGVALGYWPASIFNNGAMTRGSEEVMFGGETDGNGDYPPMGSGADPNSGYSQAAYHRNISYLDTTQQSADPSLQVLEPTTGEYKLLLEQPVSPAGQQWGTYFYFGGPGGK